MGDFFKPWRRKIGAVSLVMACVFSVGLVRSFYISDVMEYFPGESSMIRLISWRGNVSCSYLIGKPPSKFVKRFLFFAYENPYPFETEFEGCQWDWRVGHMGVATCSDTTSDSIAVVSPYWSIVFPLTLLSAYLLLTKPRTAKPKTNVEHRLSE
jgi:hypothetical protein